LPPSNHEYGSLQVWQRRDGGGDGRRDRHGQHGGTAEGPASEGRSSGAVSVRFKQTKQFLEIFEQNIKKLIISNHVGFKRQIEFVSKDISWDHT